MSGAQFVVRNPESRAKARSVFLVMLMIISSLAAFEFAAWEAHASSDADGDGLT